MELLMFSTLEDYAANGEASLLLAGPWDVPFNGCGNPRHTPSSSGSSLVGLRL